MNRARPMAARLITWVGDMEIYLFIQGGFQLAAILNQPSWIWKFSLNLWKTNLAKCNQNQQENTKMLVVSVFRPPTHAKKKKFEGEGGDWFLFWTEAYLWERGG